MWGSVLHAGRGTFHWQPLCADVRGLILSKLSLRDLARAGRTCREFEEAYLGRVAEERARLIALGKEAYGEGMFCSIVRAFQRGMCGLDPCPGVVLDLQNGDGVHINGAGEFEARRESDETVAEGPISQVRRFDNATHVLGAQVEINLPPVYDAEYDVFDSVSVSQVLVELRRTARRGLQWTVSLGKEAPAPAIGLLLAICTENPETLTPCFQRPGTMNLGVDGISRGSASSRKREAEEVTGPLGLLAELLTIHPPSHVLVTPLGEPVQARPRGVLKSVKVSWDQ
jgi:hypothetical protein